MSPSGMLEISSYVNRPVDLVLHVCVSIVNVSVHISVLLIIMIYRSSGCK